MFSDSKYVAGYSLAYCLLCAVSMIVSTATGIGIAMLLTFLPFGPVISAIGTAVHARKKLNWRIPLLWLVLTVIMWIISIVVFVSRTGGV